VPVRIGISACLLGEEVRLLDPFEADHYVVGIQDTTRAAVRVTAAIYRKIYRDYPASSQIASLSLANVGDTFAIRDILFPMTSAGRGRANLAGAYRLLPGWEASTRLAYRRGRPFTPFDMAASTAQSRASTTSPASTPAGFPIISGRRNLAGCSWDRRQNTIRVNEQIGISPILGVDWALLR
jgi:hypothetical protein